MIQSIARDGTRAWEPLGAGYPDAAIVGGDLVLNVRHVFDVEELADDGFLDHWATELGFSLQGIESWKALMVVLLRVIFEDIVGDGPRPPVMPDYAVRIDGAFAASVIVDSFDGPFESNEDYLAAVARRLDWTNNELLVE